MKRLKGLDGVLKNLNKAIKKQQLGTKRGLYASGLIIKANAVKKTSIDLGNLRSSCFVMVTNLATDNPSGSFSGDDSSIFSSNHSKAISEGKSIVGRSDWDLVGIVAYSAYYALYVHEMPATYNFNQGENKFLEKAVMETKKQVIQTLIKYAKV